MLSFSYACSEEETPEQQIHNYIDTGKAAVESRDLSDFKSLIATDYRDHRNNNKANITRIAAGLFLRNKNINLFTQVNEIYFPSPDQADVQLYVAMTGQSVADIGSLFNIRADIYQFDLKLVREGNDWLLKNARWKRVRPDNLKQP